MKHRYNAVTANLNNATLYGVALEPLFASPQDKSAPPSSFPPQGQYFKFEARSIREGWPPVTIGDKVLLKPLNWPEQRAEGVCLEARVWSLQKFAGIIVLRCDKLIYCPGMSFVVQWRVQDRFFSAAHQAIAAVDRALSTGISFMSPSADQSTLLSSSHATSNGTASPSSLLANSLKSSNGHVHPLLQSRSQSQQSSAGPTHQVAYDTSLARSWLFPTEHDLDPTSVDWPSLNSFNWHDDQLNPEQQMAIRAIVHGRRRVPFLISGPPGTGKTKLLVESIFQILKNDPKAHILVCGASNPSADTLTRRLSAGGLDVKQLFRLCHPSRPLDEVRGDIMMFTKLNVEHGEFEMPPLKELLSFRVVVTSATDSSLLYANHACNSSLQSLSQHVTSTIYPFANLPTPPHWTHLLFDEAAQAHEPDSLIPLSAMLPISPSASNSSSETQVPIPPQIVFCGDTQQLGPRIWSDEARTRDLDNSLLGRLFLRSAYADHPESRRHLRQAPKKTLTMKKKARLERQTPCQPDIPFSNLIRNYRSHTAILCGPSAMFYEDTLVPCASEAVLTSRLPEWQGLLRPGFPVSFWHSGAEETLVHCYDFIAC